MVRVERFEELEVWKAARRLAKDVYGMTREGAFARDFGLRDQIQRAAVSIMSNIAEGFERGGDKEFARYLTIAKGSAGEVRSQLFVASDLGYIDQDTFVQMGRRCVDISSMLAGLIRYLVRPNTPEA